MDEPNTPPRVPSGYEIERAMTEWQQLQQHASADEELVELARDDPFVMSWFAAAQATDPRDLLDRLIDAIVWTERKATEAKTVADEFIDRRRRLEARANNAREIVHSLMEGLRLERAEAKFARASIADGPVSVLVLDEGKIPDEYFKTERTLRKSDVLADLKVGVVIDGAQLSNGGSVLKIARVR